MHWAIRVRGWRGGHPTLHSSARPQVARAVQAARMAQAGVTRGMDSAMAGLGALLSPTIPATRVNASLGSSMAVQLPSALMRETTRAAWLTGRRPEDVLEEALSDWLAGYESAPVAALAPMRTASRQNSWGEIEETLRALRAS